MDWRRAGEGRGCIPQAAARRTPAAAHRPPHALRLCGCARGTSSAVAVSARVAGCARARNDTGETREFHLVFASSCYKTHCDASNKTLLMRKEEEIRTWAVTGMLPR